MVTNWIPDLSDHVGPLYQRLADHIEKQIDAGQIAHGEKLPPQRDLAFDLKTTIGTIGRAYRVLRERGLVSGEVGRGTYVTAAPKQGVLNSAPVASRLMVAPPDAGAFGTRPVEAAENLIRFDSTSAPDVGQAPVLAKAVATALTSADGGLIVYVRNYPRHWFEAGQQWLSRCSFRPPVETIVPTLGVQAGVMSAVCALTSLGDYIAFDHLTYGPVARSSGLMGRRIALVESDDEGMSADSLDHICRQKHPKAVFLQPTAHNPTLVMMSEQRRRAIADVARRHNLILIEDDLYGSMSGDETPMLAEFAPERTIVVSGLSKAVGAGIRGGWISCPPAWTNRIRIAHRMVAGAMPGLLVETSAQLVLSGQAGEIAIHTTAEIRHRIGMVRDVLDGYEYNALPNIPFVWLSVTGAWTSAAFRSAALDRGVLIDDEDEFKAGRSDRMFHRVRFAISARVERDGVAQGLAVIRTLLDEGRVGGEWSD